MPASTTSDRRERIKNPLTVLLTGATGSLGSHICAEILATTTARIYCLVRSPDRAAAARRLRERLALIDAQSAIDRHRVLVIPGDLELPLLGMSGSNYDELATTVDMIVHCAADVNLIAPFEKLAPINVCGTERMLDLARRSRELMGDRICFHFVSTLATVAGARKYEIDDVDELIAGDIPIAVHDSGYSKSKAIAETAVRRAARTGLPVTVYRPGAVTGHSRTGRTTDTDITIPLLRACIALGAVPAVRDVLYAEMIDMVACAIVAISFQTDCAGRTFHPIRPTPLPLSEFFGAARRAGFRLRTAPPEEWWARVEKNSGTPAVNRIAVMSEFYRYAIALDSHHGLPRYRSEETWSVLGQLGVEVPPYDAAYFDRVVADVVHTRTLHPATTE